MGKVNLLIKKGKRVLKEEGIISFIKKSNVKIYNTIKFRYMNRQSVYMKLFNKYRVEFEKILAEENYDAIVVFDSRVGWHMPLFQRSQHMANELTKKGFLYLYRASETFDAHIDGIEKIKERLYIVNISKLALHDAMFAVLKESNKPKYLSLYSSDIYLDESYIKSNYLDNGFKIIYEYIDEIADEISGEVPEFVYTRHNNILKDTQHSVIASADKLLEDVKAVRGDKNLALATNGVQYDDWTKEYSREEIPEKMKAICEKGNPIIGYYGALAKWFDYDLLIKLAKERPNYEIVLIGFLYDGSYKNSGIEELENVHYLGTVPYVELASYAHWFDITTIPFLINDITESTSPVKLFEYMAIGKPIVTTNMRECRKYKSVMVAKDEDEFVNLIDKGLNLDRNSEYYKYLKDEALENTWERKAECLHELIMHNNEEDK